MTASGAVVFVVDDDPSVRRALDRLLRASGHRVETFASARDVLERGDLAAAACLVLDVRMPGQSGLDFHRVLALGGHDVPIVFITGHGDVPMAVRAMKAGAVDFLTKPFEDEELLDAVRRAIQRDRARRDSPPEAR
jgi:FixJ family two-component response regulator